MILLFFALFLLLIFLARYNFFRVPHRGILVLLYHRISDEKTGSSLDKFSISLKSFERQVYTLKKRGFLNADPDNIEEISKKRLYLKNRYVMFTFDDGYKDNLQAAKILKKYGYSGLFFIGTAYLGGKLNGVEMLTEEDLINLRRSGMFLGSHSHEHVKLSELPPSQMKAQIEKSFKLLSKFQKVEDFAYPFGNYSEEVIELVKSLGFKRAYIIGQKIYRPHIHSAFKIPRSIMRRDLNKIDFYLIITRGRARF